MDCSATYLSSLIMKMDHDFSDYKYTIYRCASKIAILKKSFYTRNIPYKLVQAVLKRHGLEHAGLDTMITPFEIIGIIYDIFLACEKLGHFTNVAEYKLQTSTSMLSTYFWNVFDPIRKHSISLLEIKVTFLLICKQQMWENMVNEFYNLLCNPKSNLITMLNFENFLKTLVKTLTYIREGAAYGSHNVPFIMEALFTKYNDGITESKFFSLWTKSSRFLIYANLVSLIKRMEDSEMIVHNNMCISCHSEKILGMRFKCYSCKDLSLCLRCFAKGYVSAKHGPGHHAYEILTEDKPQKNSSHYFAKLCAFFQRSKKCEEKNNCSAAIYTMNESELETILGTNNSSNVESISVVSANNEREPKERKGSPYVHLAATAANASKVYAKLKFITDRLLLQNVRLKIHLKCVKTASHKEISDFLEAHQQFLTNIIRDMRIISQNAHLISYPSFSTPNNSVCANNTSSNGDQLTHSINGADINRTYLEANKSDYSLQDVSVWFNNKPSVNESYNNNEKLKSSVIEIKNDEMDKTRDTELTNLKPLLNEVKEILEDALIGDAGVDGNAPNLEMILHNINLNKRNNVKST